MSINTDKVTGLPDVSFEPYGDYTNGNYGLNTIKIRTNGHTFWFSYDTLVAFKRACGTLRVHESDWGRTPGKHLNWIDGGDTKSRLSDREFRRMLQEDFGGEVEAKAHGSKFSIIVRPVKL